MRFWMTDHGQWLTDLYDRPSKAMLCILGNPLVAITMLEHDVTAGLNVLPRVLIYEDAEGRTPSSMIFPRRWGDLGEKTQAAARMLDAKLAALAEQITGATAGRAV